MSGQDQRRRTTTHCDRLGDRAPSPASGAGADPIPIAAFRSQRATRMRRPVELRLLLRFCSRMRAGIALRVRSSGRARRMLATGDHERAGAGSLDDR
jgi:hypothetical protein